MITRPLSAAAARELACTTGVQRDMVRKALAMHERTGGPVAVYQTFDLLPEPGAPPSSAAAVIYTHGSVNEGNDGWYGQIILQVTNQQELNRARAVLTWFVSTLRDKSAFNWSHL